MGGERSSYVHREQGETGPRYAKALYGPEGGLPGGLFGTCFAFFLIFFIFNFFFVFRINNIVSSFHTTLIATILLSFLVLLPPFLVLVIMRDPRALEELLFSFRKNSFWHMVNVFVYSINAIHRFPKEGNAYFSERFQRQIDFMYGKDDSFEKGDRHLIAPKTSGGLFFVCLLFPMFLFILSLFIGFKIGSFSGSILFASKVLFAFLCFLFLPILFAWLLTFNYRIIKEIYFGLRNNSFLHVIALFFYSLKAILSYRKYGKRSFYMRHWRKGWSTPEPDEPDFDNQIREGGKTFGCD